MAKLDSPEQKRRLKKAFKICVFVFIAITSLFVLGFIINDEQYYNIVGNYVFLAMPVTVFLVILYHKGFIFKPDNSGI